MQSPYKKFRIHVIYRSIEALYMKTASFIFFQEILRGEPVKLIFRLITKYKVTYTGIVRLKLTCFI